MPINRREQDTKKMKIMFDSNVWQIVASPDDSQFVNDPCLSDFKKIRKSIVDGNIEPYLSETVFTIEAIKKADRQSFLSSTNSKLDLGINSTDNNSVSFNFKIGSNDKNAITFSDKPILKKYFDEAINLGFRIVRLPRIGGLTNMEIESVRYELQGQELSEYLDKVFDVSQEIEDNGGGSAQLEKIGQQSGNLNWLKGLKDIPDKDSNKIAKAAAEWADGDSVAICIALSCDFFCTRDRAKGAGAKSVLSLNSLERLKERYGFKTILPEELAKLI